MIQTFGFAIWNFQHVNVTKQTIAEPAPKGKQKARSLSTTRFSSVEDGRVYNVTARLVVRDPNIGTL